ncbi:unnamed protein product [Caenorhabditis angaria]|uniref:G-protein coupled receptors family 1 profile domain-containing protein n=1 Tax=Caenorhabditis angaria TaxID=860376 RepID=A0A9P1ITM3_9PELO|nr:unnamed protein product [Caenorhabditis angaria]
MLYATDEAREKVRPFFITRYNADISQISFLNIVWWSEDTETVIRCWLACLVVTLISAFSITTYCILGYKIVRKLQNAKTISSQTKRLHRQLFKTLVIQTLIPLVISFLPCMVVWFLPLFGIDIWNYGNIGVVALSAFPFLDAIAVILLLPVYRNRFKVSSYRETNISKVSFVNIIWWSTDKNAMLRSWIACLIVTMISAFSISTYCILGYKIVKKLQNVKTISNQTRKIHRQLFKTLVIQTLIPIFISFIPCMFVWFLPLFGIDIWNYGNIGVVALSAFPFLDAVAVIILLPVYRNRFRKTAVETSIRTTT